MSVNTCVCCGKIIPEGSHICLMCRCENEMQTFNLKSKKPKTNGDRIRQMTDEELAALIANENDFCSLCAYKSNDQICCKPLTECTHGFYEWLKQEVEKDDER